MKEHQAGITLSNVVISFVAGAVGCIVILMITHGPGMQEKSRPDSAAAGSGLSAVSVADSQQPGSANGNSGPARLADSAEIHELEEALQAATEERAQLSATLVTLNRQLNDLDIRVAKLIEDSAIPEDVTGDETGDETSADSDVMSIEEIAAHAGFRTAPSERQYEGLLAAGLDEQTARDLQSRNDRYQLSRLELFDQAAREGWDDSDQLRESLEALEESRPDLREELGDSLYDQYLYEAGEMNRVAVDSVISGSAASQAGLQTGDLIISYAGERTFAARDLQQATRSGTRGESVQLVFERDGQILSTDMLRGPLGVTLRPSRQQP